MAKPVGSRCNLACEYCYYNRTSDTDNTGGDDSSGRNRMSDELLERFIRQYIKAGEGPEVRITWHGGEPTLAGLDFYRRAVELQKRYLPEGWACRNNLQTNGALLDDEWCAFLAEERFDVGLSVDGAEWLHDTYRKDYGGRGSYRKAAAAVRRLQAHGIQPDLLCTVTSSAARAPLAVYRALRELGTGWLQFIPIVRRDGETGLTPDSVTAEGYGDFLCAVFDEWALRDIGRLDVQLFAEAARVWSGGAAGLCWMAPTCGRAIIVEMDGGVYSCDHYVYPEYRIGDIRTGELRDLADLPVQTRFGDDKRDRLNAQCRSCPWLPVCNGGCPKDRFVTGAGGGPTAGTDSETPLNCLCAGLRRFFAHAHPVAAHILRLARSGLPPAAIMAELRGQARAAWKGVSRNDLCPCGSGRKAKHCCWGRRP
jgi:uncharacterized protein